VCFDGNGYSEEWQQEAVRRGLDVETRVPEMFKAFTRPESVAMFTRTGVFSEKELAARNEVKWDTYSKKVQIESRVMARMAVNHIIPAAIEYKTRLLKELALNQQVLGSQEGCSTELDLVHRISACIEEVSDKAEAMRQSRKRANAIDDEYKKAVAYYGIAQEINALRKPIDKLEELVDNQLWPLPKYRELLFIS
jgi:glutamine synthetase